MPLIALGFTTLYGVLARLQQFSTFFLIAASLVWAAYALTMGRPGLAAAGVLLILFGYVVILGIEFAVMQIANLKDPLPAARLGELVAAWSAEARCAVVVFCWRQPFRSTAIADRPHSQTGRRGLVLAHGFLCNRGVWNAWYPRLVGFDIPFIGVNFEPVFGDIDGYAERLDHAISALQESTGLPPVVVAHSMGGLAVRAWLRHTGLSAIDRAHHIVTLGTPHRGTWLARFGIGANARQMLPSGAWLGALLGSEAASVASRFTCLFSNCDNIVFPTSTAILPNARNIHIPACAHVQMVDHPDAFAEVMRWLEMDTAVSKPVIPDTIDQTY